MLGMWLGRVVGFGFVAGVLVACSTSTSEDDTAGDASPGSSDGSVDSGSDASPYTPVVDDAGTCVSNCHVDAPCTTSTQCASGTCTNAVCVDPSCTDGQQDGTETAIDCGGICSACADNLACLVGEDCISGVCNGDTKLCSPPTDTDGVKNGNESGTDCGSSGTGENTSAPACGDGQGCKVAADCANKLCGDNDTCTPASCMDTILNGTETGLDCGGLCNGCADGIACKVNADCVSKSCDSTATLLCLAPTSSDGIMNGNETDTDCGSGGTNDGGYDTHAPACPDTGKCVTGADCLDLVCGTNGTCSAPTCKDGQINGGETDTDCGNGIITGCPACPDKEICGANSDCTSLHCVGSKCAVPTDTDGIQNGKESDIDCGSSGTGETTGAPACPDINATTKKVSMCSANADCKSTWCNTTEKQCVDGQSCALPTVSAATGILDISVEATATSDAKGVANTNGAGLYAGIDTCGVGEATDSPADRALESCCKSLDTTVTGEGAIRVDKYEVTSGRMRQFIETINELEGDYDIQKWVLAQFTAAGAPNTAVGTTLYSQIPTPAAKTGATDTRYLYPSSKTGTLNAVEQLGGVSMDTGVPSDLQGCFVGTGNAGASTYWWDLAGEAVVGSPPRNFTQDYYDIKSMNCAPYWMAAAFCAWDGGRLTTAADMSTLWGTTGGSVNAYPWGAGSRNFQALGGDTAWKNAGYPAITTWTIDNLNDYSGGYFYTYPASNGDTAANPSNPSTGPLGYMSIPDTIDSTGQAARLLLADFTPYIASPGRFTPDMTALGATAGTVYAGEHWFDLASNLFEYKAIPTTSFATQNNTFCDTTGGVLNSGTTASTCDATAGSPCTRANYQGKQLCGYLRGVAADDKTVDSIMPSVGWEGGSWEVHAIATGGNGSTQPMHTQYGKAGFRCARAAE
jgi:hypothetical protein